MKDVLSVAKNIIEIEKQGVEDLFAICNSSLENAINVIAKCTGYIILTGIGKSGNVACKIASTMSSVGIPSFFLDPFNAGHGDMGTISNNSVLIAISNSGESLEIMSVINFCIEKNITVISITRNEKSTIAQNATISIVIPQSKEAHAFGAPTTSTTQTLIIGDILAVSASNLKNFTIEDYARLHPSGNLGMKISKASTVMNHEFETVLLESGIKEILEKMTNPSNGFVCVIENDILVGIITDGDIRRFLLQNNNIQNAQAKDLCNFNTKFIKHSQYIIDAIDIFSKHSIQIVIIVDDNHTPIGYISKKQFNIL